MILSRPGVRNAVDGPTAAALAEAFLAFERDPGAQVAVLFGDGGTFCAGADLKAISSGRGNRVDEPATGRAWDPLATGGPMGPSRMLRCHRSLNWRLTAPGVVAWWMTSGWPSGNSRNSSPSRSRYPNLSSNARAVAGA